MAPTDGNFFLFEYLEKGGWVMLPLLACSVLALTVVVERFLFGPRRERILPKKLREESRSLLKAGKFDELTGLCRGNESSLARVLFNLLENRQRSRTELIETTEALGKQIALDMQKYLGVLGTIAAITPLLGLLGTVFGMIQTFNVIQTEGVGNANALAGGISEALITTATGLCIAIPSFVFYKYFLQLSKKLVLDLEREAMGALLLIQVEGQTASPLEQG